MKEFNYKKAWQKVALPGWESLPRDVRQLVYMTCCALPYGQSASLDMEWPDKRVDRGESIELPSECAAQVITGTKCCEDIGHHMFSLQRRFENIDTSWLSQAARVVFDYGHWAPGCPQQPTFDDAPFVKAYAEANVVQKTGGHWKFSNLADQILTAKIGMPRVRSPKGNGVSFVVLEGALRCCFASRGMRVVIVASDKDLMQLVDGQCVLWDGKDTVTGIEEVEKRFGVHVYQLRDYLAICGDSSDNVPGLKGAGPKAAVAILNKFGTLQAALDSACTDLLEPFWARHTKYRSMLRAQHDAVLLSQRLVTLAHDAPVALNTEETQRL
jgi:hypothetical protein